MTYRSTMFTACLALAGCMAERDLSIIPTVDAQLQRFDAVIQPDALADAEADATRDLAAPDAEPDATPPPQFALPRFDMRSVIDLNAAIGWAIQPSVALGVTTGFGLAWCGMSDEDLGIWFGTWTNDGSIEREPYLLSTANEGIQNEPRACALAGGGYAVTWSMDSRMEPTNLQVRYRLIGADGQPVGQSDQRIGSDDLGNHWLPKLACDQTGGFVITGVRSEANNTFGVFAQAFDGEGQPTYAPVTMNMAPEGSQIYPAVGVDANGRALVVWEDQRPGVEANRLRARWIDAAGNLGPEFTASGVGSHTRPEVSIDPVTGAALVSAIKDQQQAVLYRVSSGETMAQPVGMPFAPLSYNAALANVAGSTHAVAYLSRAGGETSVTLTSVDRVGALGETVTLDMGALPPYALSIDYRDGRLGVLWTQRLQGNQFFLKAALMQTPRD